MTLQVQIGRAHDGYLGRVTLADAKGAQVERSVNAPTCHDVTAGLALISAVIIDALPASTLQPSASVQQRPKERRSEWYAGAALGVHDAVAPSAVPTVGISAGLGARDAFGAPMAMLQVLAARSQTVPVSNAEHLTMGNARFSWLAARFSGCPLHARFAATTVGPCLVVELGRLTGTGSSALGDTSKTGWWVAPGLLMNWAWQADPVWVRLSAGAVRPLVRDSFKFIPDPLVFRPPSLGVVAEFQIGWAFN